ncbi:hypothetical protein BDR03DRAFT_226836 [Suillus americanus]|nr:hypothetical protein BDR03DRAFT_226836 [Suillus americanus]
MSLKAVPNNMICDAIQLPEQQLITGSSGVCSCSFTISLSRAFRGRNDGRIGRQWWSEEVRRRRGRAWKLALKRDDLERRLVLRDSSL